MKPTGIGVKFIAETKQYEARLGVRHLGYYRTLEDAAKAYNDSARKLFSFPILNKNETQEEVLEIIDIAIKNLEEDKVSEPIKLSEQKEIKTLDDALDLLKGTDND